MGNGSNQPRGGQYVSRWAKLIEKGAKGKGRQENRIERPQNLSAKRGWTRGFFVNRVYFRSVEASLPVLFSTLHGIKGR